jgi:hypothetical protein
VYRTVSSDELSALGSRLCHEKPVKGIVMIQWKLAQSQNVFGLNGQQSKFPTRGLLANDL